jgi:hypothetical protein
MANEPKYMSVEEFVKGGYMQEANRQFFHPLGLALSCIIDDVSGKALSLGSIWDYRDSPEGLAYGKTVINDPEFQRKNKNIAFKQKALHIPRKERLGWIIQPAIKEEE